MPFNNNEHPVILFDGVCNLCNGVVRFIIKRDPSQQFRFASLQSSFGEKVLKNLHLSFDEKISFILIEKNKIYTQSTGVLKVLRKLKGFWPATYALIIIPPFIRDVVYKWIAKNRYKWFGKKASCPAPAAETEHLFL